MRRRRLVPTSGCSVLLGSAAVLAGCAAGADIGADGHPLLDDLPRWALEEELRLGSLGDPDVGFSRVSGIRVPGDGTIYVAEAQAREIRVYEPDGRLRRRIGGQGAGPGEFGGVASFDFVGDTLAVQDLGNRRISLFTAAGEPLGTIPAPMHMVSDYAMITPSTLLSDGNVLSTMSGYYFGGTTGCPSWDSIPIPRMLFGRQGEVVDTVGWSWFNPGRWCVEVQLGQSRLGVRRSVDWQGRIPYSVAGDSVVVEPGSQPVAGGSATVRLVYVRAARLPERRPDAVTDVAGRGAERRFEVGDTVFDREYRYQAVPVTRAFADSVIGGMFRNRPGLGDVSPAEIERALRGVLEVPPYHFPVTRVHRGDDGRLWLRREDDGGPDVRWTVLAPDGEPAGELRLPRSTVIHAVNADHLYVVEPDAFDVPWVVRYRLIY